MSGIDWFEEPIHKKHDRDSFDCGDDALNEFLRRHARKSHEMGGSKTFLAMDSQDRKSILGFYSLTPASLEYARTPELLRRGLARYEVPVFRLARLAVAKRLQGMGLGGQLLVAAAMRCVRVASQVGGVALLIDAQNERVAGWYAQYGAIRLSDSPLTLVLPLRTVSEALKAAGLDSNT